MILFRFQIIPASCEVCEKLNDSRPLFKSFHWSKPPSITQTSISPQNISSIGLWLSKWCKIQHFEIFSYRQHLFIHIHHVFIYIQHLFIHIQHLFIHIQHLFIHIQHLFICIQHLFIHIQHLFIHIQHLFIHIQHLFIDIQHLCVFSISIYSSSTFMPIKLHLHSTIIFIQNVTFIFHSWFYPFEGFYLFNNFLFIQDLLRIPLTHGRTHFLQLINWGQ